MKGCLRMSARPRLLTLADCDTPRMARKPREIERVQFSVDDLDQVVGRMTKLADAGDGWINVIPHIADYDDKPTSLGSLTLLGGARASRCAPGSPGAMIAKGASSDGLGISQLTRHTHGAGAVLAFGSDSTDLVGRTGSPPSRTRASGSSS